LFGLFSQLLVQSTYTIQKFASWSGSGGPLDGTRHRAQVKRMGGTICANRAGGHAQFLQVVSHNILCETEARIWQLLSIPDLPICGQDPCKSDLRLDAAFCKLLPSIAKIFFQDRIEQALCKKCSAETAFCSANLDDKIARATQQKSVFWFDTSRSSLPTTRPARVCSAWLQRHKL
jgi:hypothetical protein